MNKLDELFNNEKAQKKDNKFLRILAAFDTIVGHTIPDSDMYFTSALLLLDRAGGKIEIIEELIKKIKFFFVKNGDGYAVNVKKARYIDRYRRDLDHHGQIGKTSFDLALEELGLAEEKWIRTPRKIIYNADCKGISSPFDINEISKSIGRSKKITDREKMELGIKTASLTLFFYREAIKRDIDLTRKIIKKFFESERKEMPERFRKYFNQLKNPRFERPCDLTEIISAAKTLYNESEAEHLGKELLEFLWKGYLDYEEAKEGKAKKHKRIIVNERADFITYIKTKNPKDHVVALKDGAISVGQENPDGHFIMFFDSKRVKKSVTDKIIIWLRQMEIFLQGRGLPKEKSTLSASGTILECPEWHYFLGEAKSNGQRGIFIFNGSLTAPDVPLSKIPTEGKVTIMALAFADADYQSRHI